MKNVIVFLSLSLLLTCKKADKVSTLSENAPTPSKSRSTDRELAKEEIIKQLNAQILQSLKQKNFEKFAQFIHPEKGVRFSMYGYVNPATDKVFSRGDFDKHIGTRTKFTWGNKDGSGETYIATLDDYLIDWVFTKDFSRSQYFWNEFKGQGNTLNNLTEVYAGADFSENYISGSEKYAYMDWHSLRLVFEKFQGNYYLIAVVNDQWTI